MTRVVLDTNIIISAALSKNSTIKPLVEVAVETDEQTAIDDIDEQPGE